MARKLRFVFGLLGLMLVTGLGCARGPGYADENDGMDAMGEVTPSEADEAPQ